MHHFGIGYDYIEVLGMEMAAGRNFSRDLASDAAQEFILNETALRAMNPADLVIDSVFERCWVRGCPPSWLCCPLISESGSVWLILSPGL